MSNVGYMTQVNNKLHQNDVTNEHNDMKK